MTKPLVFWMGRSPAILPVDRRYTRQHLWAAETPEGLRLGFSAYAVKLLGDVRRLEWSVAAGEQVSAGQAIGYVEASKATSDLYAPLSGEVRQVNAGVLADPSLVNSNLYDAGWLLVAAGEAPGLLSPEEYVAHLEAGWPLAQRLLKGQLGKAGD